MASNFFFRGRNDKKPVFKKAEAGAGAYYGNDDSMTVMDAIRKVKKSTPKQERELKQQETRLAELAAEGEKEYHEVIVDSTEISSSSNEGLGRVGCHYKRKRKCMDLSDILKRDPPVVDYPEYENSPPRKVKKLQPIRKGHFVNVDRNGRRKIAAELSLPSSAVPNSKAIHGSLARCTGSRVGHQTHDLRVAMDIMKSFSDSLGLSKPVTVTDVPALIVRKRQRSRAAAVALRPRRSPISKVGREARSSSQSKMLQTSASEADLLSVPASSLHTCADAKNCQNACVAKAVAPNLDHMSEEELIYWYEEVTKNKFISRKGEKVRGRIRRAIRAEVKGAAARTKTDDDRNNSTIFPYDEVRKCDSSAIEPRTPSPGELVVDIVLQESPPGREFRAFVGSKESISCAFNSAASFEDYVGLESARTVPNRREALAGTAVPLKDEFEVLDCRLSTEEGPALNYAPLEVASIIEEPSVVDSAEAKSVPIDIVLTVNHGPESRSKLGIECGDAQSPPGKTILRGERCGVIGNRSQSSPEEQSCLPSAESGLEGAPSSGIVDSHTLNIQLKGSQGVGPVLNACRIEENETTCRQLFADSTRESMDCVLKSGAAELPAPVVDEDIVLPIIQQEYGIEDPSVRSDEEKSLKMGPGSLAVIAREFVLFTPNLRPSSPSREQWSADSQEENETASHQPSADSSRESMDCVPNSGAAELPTPAVDEDITLPIVQQECGAEDHLCVRSGEEKSSKMGPGSSLALIAIERVLFTPNLRPSSPSREQWSGDSQDGASLQACDIRASTGHADPVNPPETDPPDVHALKIPRDLKPNFDVCVIPIQSGSNFAALGTKNDENGEALADSSQGETLPHGLFYFQETAPALRDLEDQITEPVHGISTESETGQPLVGVTCTSESQQSVDRLNQLVLVGTSGCSRDVEVSVQEESQLSCAVIEEQNTVEKLAAVCDISLDDGSQQAGSCSTSESQQSVDSLSQLVLVGTSGSSRDVEVSVPGESQLSCAAVEDQNKVEKLAAVCEMFLDDGSPAKTDGLAETGSAANKVKGIGGGGLQTCHGSLMDSDIPGGEIGVWDAKNGPTLRNLPGVSNTEDWVLSLEEYIAVHRREVAASHEGLEEDVNTQGLEEDAASELMESRRLSGKGQGDATEDDLVEEFATQQMAGSVAGCQKSDIDNDHLEGIPGRDPNEDLNENAAPHVPEDVTTEGLEEDVESEKMESLHVSGEGQGDATKDKLVDELATQQMLESVAGCQKSDIDNDHLEGIPGRDPDEDLNENAAPHVPEDVTTQGLEEDVESEKMESLHVSGEGQGDATKDESVDKFATQQMLKSVAGCQKSDTVDDHVEGISSPTRRDPDEDVVVLEMTIMDISQEIPESTRNNSDEVISTQQVVTDIASHRLQGEILSQFREGSGVQNQADAEVASKEIECCTSQGLEEDGTGQVKEKEVISFLNPYDGNTVCLDEGAVSLEYVEEDFTARKMVNCANQQDADLWAGDVTVPDPEEVVGCKAMEEGMSQKQDTDGAAIEIDEFFATQEIVEIALASGQRPREVLNRSIIEEDTTPRDLEKIQDAPYLDELDASQRIQDGTTQELKEESSSLQADNDIMQGEHDSPRSSGGGVENQANRNVAPSQGAGVGVSHFGKDVVSRRKEEILLQSLVGTVAPDQIAERSESCFPGPGPTQSLEEVVCLHQMDSSDVSTFQLREDGVSEPVENFVELHPAQGVVEVRDDHTGSVGHVNDMAKADNFCEKAGEGSLDYPVVLSQPRRSESEDDIQETVADVQRATQITSIPSRRITRSSLKLEKSILEVVKNLSDSFNSSSCQSPGENSVLPHCSFTCASDWDPHSGEGTKTSVLPPADQSRPPTATLSLVSEAEIEQIDNFEYSMLQEVEWQNAGRFSDQIDMSFFEEDLAVSSPRKRKFNDPEDNSDRGKRVAVEAPLQEDTFGSVQENTPERVTEGDSMEDEHVPTALSKAMIEKNGERSGAIYTFPRLAVQESPLTEQQPNAKQKPERMIAREKRKVLLEHSPESNCDSATEADSNVCIDLLAFEKLGEEENSQDFDPPSKLLCRRKTISPLSQLELMRASNRNSLPSDDSPQQKIPAFRLKLPTGLDSHHGRASSFEREPTPPCIYLDPSNKIGKDQASNGAVVSLDSSEDDTDDSCSRHELGSRDRGGEPPRKFSLCLSPTSPSPESVRTDSSPNVSTQEPRDSQSIDAPSSKGILKTGPQACRGLCKCTACSTSRSNAEHAAKFIASQMKTFQKIAGHLTKEMQGLRTMLETDLSSPGETGKIQETLKKSKEVEEAQGKSLVSLLRDCKRYCKLTAPKPIHMRKIVFADEAGKKLCHVKTFKSQSLPKSVLDLL